MQLDLFKAELVIFPAARSVQVARMVRFFEVVQGERADAYLDKVCRKMAAHLRRCGAGEARVRSEVDAFKAAVRAEIERGIAPASAVGGGA